jgi:hypothetical protein
MNNIFLLVLVCLIANISFAQNILTVSNNPRIPAQYTDLQKAIDAAKDGDKIYVHPSPTTYANNGVIINKDISLIGGGYYNEATGRFLGETTKINRITFQGNADNVLVADCSITRVLFQPKEANDAKYENIVFEHNSISRIDFTPLNDVISGVNLSFRMNLIDIITFNDWDNYGENFKLKIENNFISLISNGIGNGIVVNNNFFNPDFASVRTALENLTDITFFNNIFYGNKSKNRIGVSTLTNCIFDYNLSYEVVDSFTGGNQNVFGSNNVQNTDPQFTAFPATDFFAANFALKTTSPAKGKGTSGSDIGVLGGQYPFTHTKPYNYPAVTNIVVSTPIIDQSGAIKFTIKAENQ